MSEAVNYDTLVIHMARKYHSLYQEKVPLDDLIQEGRIGTFLALKDYDKSSCMESTYVFSRVQSRMLHCIRTYIGYTYKTNKSKDKTYRCMSLEQAGEIKYNEKFTDDLMARSILNCLPERTADLVWKAYVDEYSYNELSSMFNITVSTVTHKLRKAKLKIRECYNI